MTKKHTVLDRLVGHTRPGHDLLGLELQLQSPAPRRPALLLVPLLAACNQQASPLHRSPQETLSRGTDATMSVGAGSPWFPSFRLRLLRRPTLFLPFLAIFTAPLPAPLFPPASSWTVLMDLQPDVPCKLPPPSGLCSVAPPIDRLTVIVASTPRGTVPRRAALVLTPLVRSAAKDLRGIELSVSPRP